MMQTTGNVIQAELIWLTLSEFSEVSGLSSAQVVELVELGILRPAGSVAQEWLFNQHSMGLASRLRRLREDLDLNLDLHALALGFRLLERIEELEAELRTERVTRVRD